MLLPKELLELKEMLLIEHFNKNKSFYFTAFEKTTETITTLLPNEQTKALTVELMIPILTNSRILLNHLKDKCKIDVWKETTRVQHCATLLAKYIVVIKTETH